MDKNFVFERNLLALSARDPGLCSRLSGAETTLGRYRFLEARTGETVPALVDGAGTAHPLHSLMDPRKEAARLMEASLEGAGAGYLVLLGLGGGFLARAALEGPGVSPLGVERVLVLDYDINGTAELLASGDYIQLFKDPRFSLLIDPSHEALERHILESYLPVLHGGIRVIPLRARTEYGREQFAAAGESLRRAIDQVSGDYSVQAFFGRRWFANIIRNLPQAEARDSPLPPVREAVICAAGPSLEEQLPEIASRCAPAGGASGGAYLVATDTALPCLLGRGIVPNAVVSIDCQHISYQHFMEGLPAETVLFLDLASPPLLASLSSRPRFFAGGHPLARYLSRYWRPFPEIDTSGANVTYAALSLAEYLGARRIRLYGADFSYPLGKTYARGTYIYPYFDARQHRLAPLETQASGLLYRSASLLKLPGKRGWYYETPVLRGYRRGIEARTAAMEASVSAAPGGGAPINLPPGKAAGDIFGTARPGARPLRLFTAGAARGSAGDFLQDYRRDVAALPLPEQSLTDYLAGLGDRERLILTSLLPGAAHFKRRYGKLAGRELLEAARKAALAELDA
ncbi:MAG: DUF115 domain-containing protein, partial [Treponema sp.]|nr:DUF115 domain-containing protein [Treponema sp.]